MKIPALVHVFGRPLHRSLAILSLVHLGLLIGTAIAGAAANPMYWAANAFFWYLTFDTGRLVETTMLLQQKIAEANTLLQSQKDSIDVRNHVSSGGVQDC